jgi:hypothetical protein
MAKRPVRAINAGLGTVCGVRLCVRPKRTAHEKSILRGVGSVNPLNAALAEHEGRDCFKP